MDAKALGKRARAAHSISPTKVSKPPPAAAVVVDSCLLNPLDGEEAQSANADPPGEQEVEDPEAEAEMAEDTEARWICAPCRPT